MQTLSAFCLCDSLSLTLSHARRVCTRIHIWVAMACGRVPCCFAPRVVARRVGRAKHQGTETACAFQHEVSCQQVSLTQRRGETVYQHIPTHNTIHLTAHTIHPLAGQGVNLGFLDVSALVETLKQAQQQGHDISSLEVLENYQSLRRGDNLRMMSLMESFSRLFGNQHTFSLVF